MTQTNPSSCGIAINYLVLHIAQIGNRLHDSYSDSHLKEQEIIFVSQMSNQDL